MVVRNFLSWAQTATAAQRAEGAGALARAYLYSDLDPSARRDAEIALTALLDDPSPLVRRALADNFASAAEAPPAIVSALARDQSEIAAPILSRSPVLTDADLIDCAAIGDAFAQSAIALRARVPATVCAALAEVGAREAAISLAVNPGAELPETAMLRMTERFGDDGELREALLSRPWLPASIRNELVKATAATLAEFALGVGWLTQERADRLSREERDKANVAIVAETAETDGWDGVRGFVSHLRASGQLTTSLALRALLSGDLALFQAALVELSGLREEKVAGLLQDFRGAGFGALFVRAGMPAKFLPAFRAAIEAQREHGGLHAGQARLSLFMVERVLSVCQEIDQGGFDKLISLLRRFQMEAALEEARLEAGRLAAQAEATRIAAETPVPEMVAPIPDNDSCEVAPALAIDLTAFEAELMEETALRREAA
jgi:uncharacterized protein (DUF2336 family)